jgi:DNA-binding MarR family transcriptional regulator
MAAAKPSPEDYERAARLREALRRFQRRSDDVAAAHGLTSRTYQLLLMVKTSSDGKEQTGLSELEERLKLGKSTVTELVLRIEKGGFVRRHLDPDRPGAIVVRLTPVGERRLAKVLVELGDERRRLIDLLAQLR